MLVNFQMSGLLNSTHVRIVGISFVQVLYINWSFPYYVFSLFKHLLLEGENIKNLIGDATSWEGKLRLSHLYLGCCLWNDITLSWGMKGV